MILQLQVEKRQRLIHIYQDYRAKEKKQNQLQNTGLYD